MQTARTQAIFLICFGIFFFILAFISPIFGGGSKVGFFFCLAMGHASTWIGYTLYLTSRKIEELQTQVEELTRQVNETKSAS